MWQIFFASCHNLKPSKHKNYVLDYFKIIIKISEIIKIWNMWQKSFALIVHPKNHFLVASNNTYMANQQMKVYFVIFFHPKFLVVCN